MTLKLAYTSPPDPARLVLTTPALRREIDRYLAWLQGSRRKLMRPSEAAMLYAEVMRLHSLLLRRQDIGRAPVVELAAWRGV